MKNSKNKRTTILIVILLGLLIIAYKVMFVPTSEDLTSDENIIASERIESVLKEIENVNFDLSVVENDTFKSLKSIEIPLIALPVGRVNPFAGTAR